MWIVVDIRPHGNTSGEVYVVKDGSTFGIKQAVTAPRDIYVGLAEGDIVSINGRMIMKAYAAPRFVGTEGGDFR